MVIINHSAVPKGQSFPLAHFRSFLAASQLSEPARGDHHARVKLLRYQAQLPYWVRLAVNTRCEGSPGRAVLEVGLAQVT